MSQSVDLSPYKTWLFFVTDTFLAYIMMKVGFEFIIEKKKWKNYIVDYGVASLAAGLPWMFCFLYFINFGSRSWEENLLLARFAGPTATGILFTMLSLAGLGFTWLFRKIEVLIILDDLDTILFLIPLQFLLSGGKLELIFVAIGMVVLIALGWRYMHMLKWPSSRPWLFFYALVISGITEWLGGSFGVEVEVLLPSFILGVLFYNPHAERGKLHKNEPTALPQESLTIRLVDGGIKLLFMFLVGLVLPKIEITKDTFGTLLLHVFFITLLINLGKLAPAFFYRKEASFRERLAIGIGMMPRGEMGAGILTIALAHGIKDSMAQAAALSLALNLFLTGFFIWAIIWLLKPTLKTK